MAKGSDHEIMRTLETHLKAVPWKIGTEFCGHEPSSVVERHMVSKLNAFSFTILFM